MKKDTVSRGTGRDLSKLMRRLYEIKRDHFGCEDYFLAAGDDKNNVAVLERGSGDKRFIGVFSLRSLSAEASVDLPDGTYPELISGTAVEVRAASFAVPVIPLYWRRGNADRRQGACAEGAREETAREAAALPRKAGLAVVLVGGRPCFTHIRLR